MTDEEKTRPIQAPETDPGNDTLIDQVDPRRHMPERGRLQPVLCVLSPPGVGSLHIINKREFTIGRSPEADVCVDDSRASRYHAVVLYDNIEDRAAVPSCVLEDRGSRNGTFLNESRLGSPRALHHGDQLLVGNTALGFYIRSEIELQTDEATRKMLKERGYISVEARLPLELEVNLQIVFPEETFSPAQMPGLARDVSMTGMRITTHAITHDLYMRILKAPRYARVTANMPGSEAPSTFRGRVAWIHHDNRQNPPFSTVGIAFDKLLPEAAELLKNLLEGTR